MAYSITTRDGITIDNIPDDVPPDSPELRARVADIRKQSDEALQRGWTGPGLPPPDWAPMGQPGDREPVPGAPMLQQAPAPPQTGPVVPPQPTPPPERGFIGGIIEQVTGRERATPESGRLPEWTTMPELNAFTTASAAASLGTLLAGPSEIVRIVMTNFPGTKVFQDTKGNYILRSSINNQDYVIPPGVTMGDIPRIAAGIAAFTPAGMARTVSGAALAGGATQAGIETTQAATGGEFDLGEVGMAAAGGAAGPAAVRGFAAGRALLASRVQPPPGVQVPPPVSRPGRRPAEPFVGGAAPSPPPMPAAPAMEPPRAPPAPPMAPPSPGAPPQPMAFGFQGQISTEGVSDVLRLAQRAAGGNATARAQLIDMAQLNPDAAAAAQRLGLDVPFDVFADNPQVRSAVGLTRARVGGVPEAAWETTLRNAILRADQITQESDAIFVGGRPAPAVASQRVLNSLQATRDELQRAATQIYERIDADIPRDTPVNLPNLSATLNRISEELGGVASMSSPERRLYRLLENAAQPDANPITYGALLREKSQIGAALGRQSSPYANVEQGTLRRLYAALSSDQLENVGNVAGEEARRELRAANLMTARRKALENRIVAAFGQDMDGSIATRMQTAITSGARGDAAAFNRLMRTVPEDLRKEVFATALATQTASRRGTQAGGAMADQELVFGFNDFVKTYRGLRANEPLMAQAVNIMGQDWRRRMEDLYLVASRIADAQGRIPTTGKANQIINESTVTGFLGQIMSNGIAQRAATAITGVIPGGGAFAPELLNYMRNAGTRGVEAAGDLFASPGFQQLAIEVATGTGTARADTLRRVALSRQFRQYADAINLPRGLDPRLQFLTSTLQTARNLAEQPTEPNP